MKRTLHIGDAVLVATSPGRHYRIVTLDHEGGTARLTDLHADPRRDLTVPLDRIHTR